MSIVRLRKELEKLEKDPPFTCSAGPIDEEKNFFKWRAIIMGPKATPYDGGIFELKLIFPHNYPFKPPSVRFVTPVFHCNIDQSGHICMDILNSKWSPILTVSSLLLSVCTLLTDPNPDNPLGESSNLLVFNKSKYEETAKYWTRKYATMTNILNKL
ncbi:Ubiquitin-conjugating enzyme E2 4, partial [Bonamia ostreae]